MNSIFDPNDNQFLIERINKLSPQTQALWGKMSVGQMLSHMHEPLLVMRGEKVLKFTLLGMLFGNYLKKKYLKDRGFDKNLPTHTQSRVTNPKQFEVEKEKLIQTLIYFRENGSSVITKNKHPFFGNMTHEEWGDMMYIHTDHHLKQFGV